MVEKTRVRPIESLSETRVPAISPAVNIILVLMRITGISHVSYKPGGKNHVHYISLSYNTFVVVFRIFILAISAVDIFCLCTKLSTRDYFLSLIRLATTVDSIQLFHLSKKGILEKHFWSAPYEYFELFTTNFLSFTKRAACLIMGLGSLDRKSVV